MKYTKNYLIILLIAFFTISCGPKKSEDIIIYELRKPIEFYNAIVIVINELTLTIGDTKSSEDLTDEQKDKINKSLDVYIKINNKFDKLNFTDKQIDKIGVRRLKAIDRIKNIAAFLNN
jgi:hypothetical protein